MIDRRRHSPIHRLTLLLLVTSLLAPSVGIGSAAFADYWPGWRGDGSGVSPETSLPHTWSPTDNVLWAAAIPGDGLSSPIVWRDRVFLTTAGYESDWHLDTFVLLAFLSVLVPCVLCSYLRSPFPDPPRYATRIRPLTRGLLLIITFIAIACLIPIALDHVRARFPTLSVRLTGKPWHHSNELSRHIRTDAFLAGFLAVFAVLCLRPSPGRSPVLATLPPSRRQRFSVSALLLWLQCLCIIAMAGPVSLGGMPSPELPPFLLCSGYGKHVSHCDLHVCDGSSRPRPSSHLVPDCGYLFHRADRCHRLFSPQVNRSDPGA